MRTGGELARRIYCSLVLDQASVEPSAERLNAECHDIVNFKSPRFKRRKVVEMALLKGLGQPPRWRLRSRLDSILSFVSQTSHCGDGIRFATRFMPLALP